MKVKKSSCGTMAIWIGKNSSTVVSFVMFRPVSNQVTMPKAPTWFILLISVMLSLEFAINTSAFSMI